MLQRTYRVEFETDPTTKQVTAKLPTLNHTADFGDTAEEALSNLRELATGLIEVLLDQGKEIPPNDTTEKGRLSVFVTEPKARAKGEEGQKIAMAAQLRPLKGREVL